MKEEKRRIYRSVVGFCALKVFDWILRILVVCLFIALVGLAGESDAPFIWWQYLLNSLFVLVAMLVFGFIEYRLSEYVVPAYKKKIGKRIYRFEKRYNVVL